MTESLSPAAHDTDIEIERKELQARLAVIDNNPTELQELVSELYLGAHENPHVFYTAATHLTSAMYLDRRDERGRLALPEQEDAAKAFASYTQLLSMLAAEKMLSVYAKHDRIYPRLIGSREELAFHAPLTYARAHGADCFARPTPAIVDFAGRRQASDIQIFFEGAVEPDLEIQVKTNLEGYTYHPRIALLNLETVLGSHDKVIELRGLLKAVGDTTDGSAATAELPEREHAIIMDAAAAIMKATFDWGSAEHVNASPLLAESPPTQQPLPHQ